MLGKLVLLVLAALCLSGAASAQTPSGAANPSDKVTIVSDLNDACPLPDALASNELMLGCSKDVAAFLRRLRSKEACGSQDRYPIDQACAVIIYTLDPQFRGVVDLPPIVTVRVGKITQPENAAATNITVIKSNGSAEQLTPERVYELLIPIRVDERVRVHANSGTGKHADQKVGLFERGIRYYPALLVGRGEASKVMTSEATKRHFTMPAQIMQNLNKLLSYECMKFGSCTG